MAFAEPCPPITDARSGASRDGSRARLCEVAGLTKPVVLAGERRLVVPGPLGVLLPGGGLQRGSVVAVGGAVGAGASSLVLQLMAAATAAGEWAAAVDLDGTFGALAAAEAGVAMERLAVVRGVAPGRWGRVVATLLEGVSLVAAVVPASLRPADTRRLAARARERAAVLVTAGPWPGEAALRLRAESSSWGGIGGGEGFLRERVVQVGISGRGAAGRGRVAELAASWPVAS